MKILAIRIENLASLEGKTEIDFTQEPLASAGIFAITGATGAGKSTILDALCLALYAKTPRYLQAKESGIELHDVKGSTINQGDARGILRDGTGTGFSEVDFIGVDGNSYRATWQVKRARNKPEGAMQQDAMMLKNLTQGTDIGGKKTDILKEIEHKIGLNFEQFTRAVLLAQGDFTVFLRATKDEKASLLEKLTGTHIYSEISKMVFEKYGIAKQELAEVESQRKNIHLFSEEEIADKQQEKKQIEEEIAKISSAIQATEKEILWHTTLTNLEKSYAEAKKSQEIAQENKNNAATREQKLQQIEQVQKTRTWVDILQATEKQQVEKNEKLKITIDKENILQKQLATLYEKQQKLVTELEKANEVRQNAMPLLDNAKQLDTLLEVQKKQVENTENLWQEAKNIHQKQQNEVKNQQKAIEDLVANVKTLQKWKTDNEARQPIAENKATIIAELNNAQKLVDNSQKNVAILAENQEKFSQKNKEKETLSQLLASKKTELELLQVTYQQEEKNFLSIDIQRFINKKTVLDTQIIELTEARGHWKNLYSTLLNFQKISTTLDTAKKESAEKESLWKEVQTQVANSKIAKTTSAELVEKARLAATENVENLRNQLVDNEPCLVCGSTTHPYKNHNPQLDAVLQSLENLHKENVTKYETAFKEEIALQEICKNLQKTIQQSTETYQNLQNSLQDLQNTWNGFAIRTTCENIADNQKESWLAEKLQETKTQQIALKKQIEAYEMDKKQLEKQKNTIAKLEKELSDVENQRKDVARVLLSLQEIIANTEKQEAEISKSLAEVAQNLNGYFTNSDWFSKWKNNPTAFVKQVNEFAEVWKNKLQDLQNTTQSLEIQTIKTNELSAKIENLRQEEEKQLATLTKVKEEMASLYQKRQAIFEGDAVKMVESRLQKLQETAQKNIEDCKTEIEQSKQNVTQIGAEKMQIEANLGEIAQQISSYKANIQQWIGEYAQQNQIVLDFEQVLRLLAFSEEWRKTEQTALRNLDEALANATTILNEREKALQNHKTQATSEASLEEVQSVLLTQKTSLEQSTQKANEIAFQLQQDTNNREKIGDLLKIIAKKTETANNWAKLNEVIGSGDGKKFRQIAQEYTLDILLSYANSYLEMLTNRYELERIPETLGLQVIDKDMGNEIRTVFSLSGGESFLLSLALALGLASLSSNKMRVESLFIDEGFGSLDPATLNIAMDALERLHNQGRKVGVISHVQEMTERIQTQIKVTKLASGKSKVDIVGL